MRAASGIEWVHGPKTGLGFVMSDCDVRDDVAVVLDDLLSSWHAWASRAEVGHGFASTCATFRQSRTSRQYDDANGSLDAHVDAVLMEAVDAVIAGIEHPWHTALAIQARNLYTGRSVWSSPRLPACAMQRGLLLQEARNKFQNGLERAGLVR